MAVPKVYAPFGDMRRLQEEMDELFAHFFEKDRSGRELVAWGLRAPLSDIEDKGDALVVSAELPGMRKDDISITVDKESLVISAERKDAAEERKKDYYYCERSYSGYKRVFRLPQEIDPDGVEASYEDGMLRVTMKKVKKTSTKKEVKLK